MRRICSLLLFLAILSYAVPGLHPQAAAQQQKQHPPKGVADVQADMVRARQALQSAKEELAKSGNEWGGHRMAAIQHVDQALQEVQKAEVWAKEHKAIK